MRFIPPNAIMGSVVGDEAARFKGYKAGQAADATDERRSSIQPGRVLEGAYGGESIIGVVVEHSMEVIKQGLVEGNIHFDDPMRKTNAPCHAL